MIVVAARDSSPADRAGADVVCDGKTDVAVLARALAVPDREVILTAGTFDANAGFTAAGNRYLRPAEGVTVRGAGPGLTRLVAEREPCRISVDAPGVTIANLGGFGYVGIQDTADRFCCEDVYLTHSLGGRTHLPFGEMGGCTGAFMVWGRRGRTVRDLTFRRCTVERSYHHGFALNLAGASEGGGFADVLFDQCHAIGAGSGLEGKDGVPGVRDWSCGFDIPDAGDVERMTVRDCQAIDCWQDTGSTSTAAGTAIGRSRRMCSSSVASRSTAAGARGPCRPSSTSPGSMSSPRRSSTAGPSGAGRPASSARTRRPAGSCWSGVRTRVRPTAWWSSTAVSGCG